jgi:hypothetical protein
MSSCIATKEVSRAADTALQTMGTVVCDGCGERFRIEHLPTSADQSLAAKQARWLEKTLAYDHECQRPHPDKISPENSVRTET